MSAAVADGAQRQIGPQCDSRREQSDAEQHPGQLLERRHLLWPPRHYDDAHLAAADVPMEKPRASQGGNHWQRRARRPLCSGRALSIDTRHLDDARGDVAAQPPRLQHLRFLALALQPTSTGTRNAQQGTQKRLRDSGPREAMAECDESSACNLLAV